MQPLRTSYCTLLILAITSINSPAAERLPKGGPGSDTRLEYCKARYIDCMQRVDAECSSEACRDEGYHYCDVMFFPYPKGKCMTEAERRLSPKQFMAPGGDRILRE
ncbi:hypothetical protein ABGN05_13990 [Aquibium sp. LZ166]|uniref:Uncharacterized protein n=1 Tax=Aquibium pacificus TaxID=3153579 RepID=A0ABV3SJ39_9HYPH